MRRIFLVGGAAFVGLVKFGNEFRTKMAQVNTMLEDGTNYIPEMTKQVRELSAEFGKAKTELADGLYQVLSAGVPRENAIEFLRVATEAAVGGVTDVKTSVDGLTTVLNAYGMAASDATQASDILFNVVKDGKVNYEELSENIGKIAPTAKVAGVGIQDLSAMIATLVKVEKPERAMTALRQSMFFAAEKGKTLLEVLEGLEGATLEDLIGAGVNKKAAAGIALMASNMGVLRKEMVKFGDTAGAAESAFKKVNAMRHWQKLWQSILVLTSRVGEMIDSKLAPAISIVAERIKKFGTSEKFDAFIDRVKNGAKDIADLIKVLSGVDGADKRREAIRSMGEIIRLSFISGAQDAVNIIAKGLEEAWKLQGERMRKRNIKRLGSAAKGGGTGLIMGAVKGLFGFSGIGKDDEKKDLINKSGTDQAIKDALENYRKIFKDVAPVLAATPPAIKGGNLVTPSTTSTIASAQVSSATSMLSTSDLFTMMQTGQAKATELNELQKQTTLQEEILEAIKEGGIE